MMEPVHKILALSYSQSGQLHQITRFFIDALHNVDIDYQTYEPENPFPFPWTSDAFFDTMPESVMEKPVKLKKINYKHIQYDLIIFAYQPWFLSPSIPASSILQDADFISRLKGTPVITLIGTRNMWLNSQNSVKKRIADAGGFIIGNIPFADRTQNQISAITILHWMLTGQKTKKWGIFPKPGVNDTDIGNASRYGEILDKAILDNDLNELQTKFFNLGFITLPIEIIFIEEKAKRLFRIWVRLITMVGTTPKKRKWMLFAFKYYLIIALFLVAPIVLGIYWVFVVPFIQKSLNQKKKLYLQPLNT